jgi:hypothetical protein
MVGVVVGCGGGVVLVAPPPHPVTNAASASKMVQTETWYSHVRNLPASRLRARSPNNMAPIPFAQAPARAERIARPHTIL